VGAVVRPVSVPISAAGQTVPEVFAEMVVYVVLAVAFSLAMGMAVVTAGVDLPVLPLTGLAVCAGGLAVGLGLHGLTERANRRRQEWRHGTAAYIQLVSSCMAVHSAETSILKAAEVGRGPVFETIANAIRSAPAMGRTRWEALDTVGRDYGVMELRDLSSAIERSSSLGASTRESVSSIAASMRSRTLDEAERAADRNSNQMFGPTYLFVVSSWFPRRPIMQRISIPSYPSPRRSTHGTGLRTDGHSTDRLASARPAARRSWRQQLDLARDRYRHRRRHDDVRGHLGRAQDDRRVEQRPDTGRTNHRGPLTAWPIGTAPARRRARWTTAVSPPRSRCSWPSRS
jgi:hypothetical protein